MEHISLGIALLTIICIVLISKAIQSKFRLPLPHSFIILAYAIYNTFPELLNLNAEENFDKTLFFTIPIILAFDAIHLKWKYVKQFGWAMIYLAVFSVAISILIGTSLYYFNVLGTGMTIGMYVALFSIVMATDAISVSNIFSQFNVPHNIKVLTEGESLGNDATAMIAFVFVGLPWIVNGNVNLSDIPGITIQVFSFSGLIGLIAGYLGYLLMKFFHDIKEETLITIAVAYVAFITAELFQLSGIFAIITAMILFKTFIDKDITEEQRLSVSKDGTLTKKLRGLKKIATTKAKHDITLSNLENYAYLATVVVFVSLASLINVYSLFTYWKDILIVFVATTIIRGIVMAKFLFLGKTTKAIDYVGFSGWVILTLAGMKGALSIVMVHALPKNFIFLEKFEAITVGVVILSIFVYGLGLLWYMINQEKKKLN